MDGSFDKNFGVIVSMLIPGFLLLAGLSFTYPDVATLITAFTSEKAPTIGGFFYATLLSLALGLLISAVRWLIVDSALSVIGIRRPKLNFGNMGDEKKFKAFLAVVENHYKYYQYYSNTLVATIASLIAFRLETNKWPEHWIVVAVVAIAITLLLASKDCLMKYYACAEEILGLKP